MAELLVFHSGNPAWMSCEQAIGVAKEMKEKYGERLELKIYTTDSKEAEAYNFRSSTNVLFEKELVPADIATDRKRMDAFLSSKLWMIAQRSNPVDLANSAADFHVAHHIKW